MCPEGRKPEGSRDGWYSIFLRVAAVNFDATVFDSNDLSTIRGSSFTLLRAPQELQKHLSESFDGSVEVTVVYEGASELVIRLTTTMPVPEILVPPELPAALETARSKKQTKKAQDKIDDYRRQQAKAAVLPLAEQAEELSRIFLAVRHDTLPLDWFLFTVTTHVARAGKPAPLDVLESKAGIEQFTTVTVPIPPAPPPGRRSSREAVCALTRVLPAVRRHGKGDKWLSESVIERRKTGGWQKQHFYEQQLDALIALARTNGHAVPGDTLDLLCKARENVSRARLGFASSFEDILADPPELPKGRLPPNVQNKLAVVYLDGNNFSAERGKRAPLGDAALTAFSDYLKLRRGRLLARLLDWMLDPANPTMRIVKEESDEPGERLRFETLVWGGDEMCFVLPAWHGWAFLGIVEDELREWPHADGAAGRLTHAAGMIFGHVKTPIRELRQAAEDLADAAKDKNEEGRSVERNGVQVYPLEGIDFAELDVKRQRSRTFPAAAAAAFSLPGERWQEIADAIKAARDGLGLSQLHHWYRKAVAGPDKLLATSDPERLRQFCDAMLGRLKDLKAAEGETAVLTTDLLRRRATDHPLIPLYQFLLLQDYVEPLAAGGR